MIAGAIETPGLVGRRGPDRWGDTFAGRVAGSLLHATGLPELVAGFPAAYESMALPLAREPTLLQALRHTLFGNRLNSPLFDIARYTRHYEAALTQMRETWANDHEPASFAVPPEEHGFRSVEYHISERYRVGMEVIAIKHG
jgi:Glycosyl transferase family 41